MERLPKDRRETLSDSLRQAAEALSQPRDLLALVRDYLGIGRRRRSEPVADRAGLRRFLETRASFVAQTSLYGYLRTRAGMRYPELFHDDRFVASINVAKWQVWLACLSDLSVYSGGLMVRDAPGTAEDVGRLMRDVVTEIFESTGTPPDAGPAFATGRDEVMARLASCDWLSITDDHAAFTESPQALVRWAPIIDEMKRLDAPIVLNSVRFRWQEVRRDLRQSLDTAALRRA
jgi:hypothetical protein